MCPDNNLLDEFRHSTFQRINPIRLGCCSFGQSPTEGTPMLFSKTMALRRSIARFPQENRKNTAHETDTASGIFDEDSMTTATGTVQNDAKMVMTCGSPRSTDFCAIWDCTSSSFSSSKMVMNRKRRNTWASESLICGTRVMIAASGGPSRGSNTKTAIFNHGRNRRRAPWPPSCTLPASLTPAALSKPSASATPSTFSTPRLYSIVEILETCMLLSCCCSRPTM